MSKENTPANTLAPAANFIKNMLGGIEATAAERQKSLEAKQDEYERIRKEIQAKSAVAGERSGAGSKVGTQERRQ